MDDLHELVPARVPVRGPLARAARERPRHARRPLPVRRVRGAAAADRLGSDRRGRPRPDRRAAARGHERGDDPRPRALRRPPRRRRRARRRARRGDGVRGARGPDVPARRLDLADRGHHARPRPRLAGARACRAWRRSGRARASAGRPSSASGSARRRESSSLWATRPRARGSRTEYGLDAARGQEPRHLPARAGERDRRRPVRPRRSSSSASATRSATGACASSRRSAGACTRRGRWRSPRGCATRSTSTRSRSGRTTASRSTSPTRTCRRPLADLLLDPGRDRGARPRRARAVGALRRALPRERVARAPHPAPPAGAADAALAAAAEGAERCSRSRAATRSSRSCSRPTASASRTSSTCPRSEKILRGIQTRELDLVEVETVSASPFASSLLFDYVATYMYEDDTPPEERRAQALSLDRGLLRELMGVEELRELLDAGAIEDVEASLRRPARNAGRAARLAPARRDLWSRASTTRASPRRCCASGARSGCGSAIAELVRRRRGRRARARRVRSGAAGRRCRTSFLEPVADALAAVLRRYARTHGPFTTGEVAERFGLERRAGRGGAGSARARRAARPRRAPARRDASASGATRTSCAGSGARRSRCCGARSSPPSRRRSAASCPSWHGIGRRQSLREALVPLQALALPVSLWESDVLPRRVPGYRPADLDALCASGEVVWVGAGPRPGRGVLPRGRSAARAARGGGDARGRRRMSAVRAALAQGALFWADLVDATGLDAGGGARRALGSRLGGRGDERLVGAAARVAAVRGSAARARAAAVHARSGGGAVADAGALVARGAAVLGGAAGSPSARGAPARAAGDRDARRRARRGDPRRLRRRVRASCARSRRSACAGAGTSSRGSAARSSRCPGRSSGCASCARAAERRRSARRSCSRRPIRLSRTARRCRGRGGRALARRAWPARGSCCSAARRRSSSSAAAARSCRCASRIPSGCGRRSRRWSRTFERGGAKRLAVERFDGSPVVESDAMELLVESGFLAGPRRAVLRP